MEDRKDFQAYEESRRPHDVDRLAKTLTELGDAATSEEAGLRVSPTVKVERRDGVEDEREEKEWIGQATVVSVRPKKVIGRGGEASIIKTPDGRTLFREEVPTLRGGKVVREVAVSPATNSSKVDIGASVSVSTARYDRRGRLLKSPARHGGHHGMHHGRHEYVTGRDRSRSTDYEGHIDKGLSRTANKIAGRVTSKLGYSRPLTVRQPYPGLSPNNPLKGADKSLKRDRERRPVVKNK